MLFMMSIVSCAAAGQQYTDVAGVTLLDAYMDTHCELVVNCTACLLRGV